MDRRISLSLILFAFAAPVLGGYAARESWIPVAGRTTGIGGRGFYTTVHLTDVSGSVNDITVSFFAAAQALPAPRSISLQLGPNQSRTIDVGPQLTGDAGATGALRIRSSHFVVGDARVFSRGANEPPGTEVGAVLNAIPADDAIGTAESTLLHVPAGSRYKLYAVETHGFPLYFAVRSGHDERRLYLSPNEQRSWDLAELFPGAQARVLQLTGINGSGKVIAAGAANVPVSGDIEAFEMSLPSQPRHRMRWPETAAYGAVALALLFAAVHSMTKR